MTRSELRFGTRGSELALWQTRDVIGRVQSVRPDVVCPTKVFSTRGDEALHTPLTEFNGQGVFTDELEGALLAGEIDVAVHSVKDLPVRETPGLTLGAMPCRADPRDVLITHDGVGLAALPSGAIIGTCSVRRSVQLLALRSDLVVRPIRGTVQARVQKVLDGQYDATILAAAGLERLGLLRHVSEYFAPDVLSPAPGQGVLAVQCRADDMQTLALLSAIDDPSVRIAAEDERARFHALEGKRIVITRPRGQAWPFAAALARYGAVPILCPAIRIDSVPDSAEFDTALRRLDRYDWIVFTSANSVAHFWSRISALQIGRPLLDSVRIAAIGSATAHALAQIDLPAQLIPVKYVAEHLADAFGNVSGRSLLLPRSAIARDTLVKTLRQRGASVDDIPIYRTAPETLDATALCELLSGVDVITFTSASAVRAFAQALTPSERVAAGQASIACIGPVTAAVAGAAGFSVDIIADKYTTDGIVQALVRHFDTDIHASKFQTTI